MKPLENFLKKNPPQKRVSKLKEYENEIMEMHKKNYKIEQIQEFLKTQDVQISIAAIYKFFQKIRNKVPAAKTEAVQNLGKPQNKAMAKFLQKVGESK